MAPDVAHERSPVPGVSRNVFLLGGVSLLNDISSEMLYPLVPLFLTQVLHAPVASVGIVEGLAEATASLMKGASGWLSDRLGRRKPFTVAGYLLSALAKPLLALASGWTFVLGARVLDRFGKGVRTTARDALIADSSLPSLRGRSFGFHRSADQVGAVVGPLLALPLLALFDNSYRTLFVVAAVPGLLGLALLGLVREPVAQAARPGIASRGASFRSLPPMFRRFLGVTLLFALGNSSDAFLLLRAQQVGASVQTVLLLFAAYNAVTVLSSYPAGLLSDRLGRKGLLVFSLGLFAAVYAGFAGLATPASLWLLFGAYGLYAGVSHGLMKAFALDLAPGIGRGTALGLQATLTGLATFPASALAGALWERLGPEAAFLYGSGMAALAGVALTLFVRLPPVDAADRYTGS